jgi:hypothetical protein
MAFRADNIDAAVERIDTLVSALLPQIGTAVLSAAQRWRGDAAALRFHLRRETAAGSLIVAVLGGTGTGKSTIVNRLLATTVSATSFRRTFTSGAVAIASATANLPEDWLGVEHDVAESNELPARGRPGELVVVTLEQDLTRRLSLVDTPDLDGDQPAHHAEADRAFRWADAVLILVTPEKYQMTEMLPYYRLADRYRLPAVFLMNKCEQQVVADDYAKLLKSQGTGFDQNIFIVARDDAGYEPPPGRNLDALRRAIADLRFAEPIVRTDGLHNRTADLLGRLGDQLLAPARQQRAQIDRTIVTLRQMETPMPGVDVNPLTQQLQRRMQQRSVLYLMGPQRALDRLRQAPGLLVRLPRVAWDYVIRGEVSAGSLNPMSEREGREVPDFRSLLIDQFNVVQSRLDDVLRESKISSQVTEAGTAPVYQPALIDPGEAGKIADEELAELKSWLERRWNATPRDTRVLESLLKFLPGGQKITQWTEAAPYLLVLVVAAATHHLFGGLDLAVIGGWSLATWLTERLSNEVAAHTRQTNQKITDRFARLAHDQIERVCRWLNDQAPSTKSLDQLEHLLNEAREALENP